MAGVSLRLAVLAALILFLFIALALLIGKR